MRKMAKYDSSERKELTQKLSNFLQYRKIFEVLCGTNYQKKLFIIKQIFLTNYEASVFTNHIYNQISMNLFKNKL